MQCPKCGYVVPSVMDIAIIFGCPVSDAETWKKDTEEDLKKHGECHHCRNEK